MRKTLLPYELPPDFRGPLTTRFREADALSLEELHDTAEKFLQLVLEPLADEPLSFPPSPEQQAALLPASETDASVPDASVTEDPLRVREAALCRLGKLYVDAGKPGEVASLFEKTQSFFRMIPKARTAKIIRNFIDLFSGRPGMEQFQEDLCLKTIEWSKEEKRTFLRHRVEARLALLYHQRGQTAKGLELVSRLLQEVKRLEDKLLLVEVYLVEAKLHFATFNVPKAKASLTASRSNASAIHCPPLLQADIDILAGSIHCEEGDPKTASSYFYEAFEAYHLADDPQAQKTLKYLMLTKIMSGKTTEIDSLLSQSHHYLKYIGRDTETFKAIARCYENRDLLQFQVCLETYASELSGNPLIERHITKIYQQLWERNILRILEPFSRVEVSHVAELMHLPLPKVQTKLSEMILDGKLCGTLDQEKGTLLLFEDVPVSSIYEDGIEMLNNLSEAVDLLHRHAEAVL